MSKKASVSCAKIYNFDGEKKYKGRKIRTVQPVNHAKKTLTILNKKRDDINNTFRHKLNEIKQRNTIHKDNINTGAAGACACSKVRKKAEKKINKLKTTSSK